MDHPYEEASSVQLGLLNQERPPFRDQSSSQVHLIDAVREVKAERPTPRRAVAYSAFYWLTIPTVVAVLSMMADIRNVMFTGEFYDLVTTNRATTSVVIQIISICLGMIQTSALSQLFNFASRISMRTKPVRLGVLQFWNGVSSKTVQWNLEPKFLALAFAYVVLTAVPGAIWAGALTPVVVTVDRTATIPISRYTNMTFLREWPSEISKSGPLLRNNKGLFTYSIGVINSGQLTQSLTTATTLDGSARRHVKNDNSNFMYVGRSYGVGASVGLVDNDVLQNPLTQSYHYQESGYSTQVTCRYNTSDDFFSISETSETMIFAASGYLTDSTGEEYSVYVGHGSDAIVAFGVAAQPIDGFSTTRYAGIAAGASYANLDAIECQIDMSPSLFNVTANATDKSITVSPVVGMSVHDIEPTGNLTHVATRQIELYSNDLTNIYQSVVGNALNFSISDYNTYVREMTANGSDSQPPDAGDVTLRGVENSFTAMMDDILVGYSSAQLVIANDSTPVASVVSLKAIRFGKSIYVYLIFGLNVAVLLLVTEELCRTRAWRQLPVFNYTNLAQLVTASSNLGVDFASGGHFESSYPAGHDGGTRTRSVLKKSSSPYPSAKSASYEKVEILLCEGDHLTSVSITNRHETEGLSQRSPYGFGDESTEVLHHSFLAR